ncbi:MAG: winged helix-turn-helix transcriptional regulator [Bacteroidetes bacterium]|jgi:DNA-binding MarR family transcriptional regulator|nr:winged helix-turn-helix transcriptional regulator [Bacteroidota bacterium]MBP7256135.1 winged helix-turn-helix transcriptional regulator [Chitinophagales bacterium]MBK7139011.1 winged helix-turn-helix transcriptional regulator [Bacteroidota bacterium]MBK7505635.1 winged helix-turn-helix transcriptional regulator [Bacteroidota bacterium]MBK7640277.1 winged helix-turn-helix transcriptional regulator [Bacteroidota bacterium]
METNYGFIIEKTSRKIKQTLQKRLNNLNIDITVDQWVIILELSRHKDLAQNEIAKKTNKDAPTVNRIIEILLKKELVSKNNNSIDKRKSVICLSNKGKKMIEKINPEIIKFRNDGWKNLSDQDLNDLKRIMQTIYQNFN